MLILTLTKEKKCQDSWKPVLQDLFRNRWQLYTPAEIFTGGWSRLQLIKCSPDAWACRSCSRDDPELTAWTNSANLLWIPVIQDGCSLHICNPHRFLSACMWHLHMKENRFWAHYFLVNLWAHLWCKFIIFAPIFLKELLYKDVRMTAAAIFVFLKSLYLYYETSLLPPQNVTL